MWCLIKLQKNFAKIPLIITFSCFRKARKIEYWVLVWSCAIHRAQFNNISN
jgi:hypothetical protein